MEELEMVLKKIVIKDFHHFPNLVNVMESFIT